MTWPEVVLPDELFSISDPQSKLPAAHSRCWQTAILSVSQGNVSEEARDVCKKLLELLGLQDVEFLMCSIQPLSRSAWERGNWTFSPFSHPFWKGKVGAGSCQGKIHLADSVQNRLLSKFLTLGAWRLFGNLHRSPLAP